MKLEFREIIETLGKCHHFNVTVLQPPFEGLEDFDYGLRRAILPELDFARLGRHLLEALPPDTFLMTKDELDCHYALFSLPDRPGCAYLCGPAVHGPMSEELRRRIAHKYGPDVLHDAVSYYQSLPFDEGTTTLVTMMELYTRAYPDREIRCLEDWNFFPNLLSLPRIDPLEKEDVRQLRETNLRRRYQLEGQLMGAVSVGDSKLALSTLSEIEKYSIPENRDATQPSMRAKLAGINAMCKLMVGRNQSVHPSYVESLYLDYTERLEHVTNSREMSRMVNQMIITYCECVQSHSLAKYSPLIQRVLNYIHLHPEENLSLKYFAQLYSFSPSYLSNLFRTETGITLTEYINRCRVERAALLLRYTDQSIAQIGESVGFLDENYFTRIFKKIKGVPPSVYRRNGASAPL